MPTLDPPDHPLGTEHWPCVLCGALGRAKTNSSMKSAKPVSAGGNKTAAPERGGCDEAGGLLYSLRSTADLAERGAAYTLYKGTV